MRYLSKNNDCLQYLWNRNRYKKKIFVVFQIVCLHSKPLVFLLFVSGQKHTFLDGFADDRNSWMQHPKYLKFLQTTSFNTIILLCSKYENHFIDSIYDNNKKTLYLWISLTPPYRHLNYKIQAQSNCTMSTWVSTKHLCTRAGMINRSINRYWKFFWLLILSLWYRLCQLFQKTYFSSMRQ